jgi:feruloyl-CoA synthase
MVLCHGGTFHIDAGTPTPAGFAETLRNLHEVAPIRCFNVPEGWQMLLDALRDDRALARRFFWKSRHDDVCGRRHGPTALG